MAETLVLFVNDLYSLVDALDRLPAAGSRRAEELAARAREALARAQQLLEGAIDAGKDRVRQSLERVSAGLNVVAEMLPSMPDAAPLRDARTKLMEAYEALRVNLRERRLPALRPRNLARNAFHVGNALLGVILYQWVLGRTGCLLVLGSVLVTYFTLEVTRRIWPAWNAILFRTVLRHISRPREVHQLPAATWYAMGTFLVVLLASQPAAQLAVLVLGLGDPLASLVGRRWGKHKIYRRKSLEGTLAFVGISLLAGVGLLAGLSGFPLGRAILIAGLGALTGAVAEALSDDRVDDNFSVPLAVALAVSLAGA